MYDVTLRRFRANYCSKRKNNKYYVFWGYVCSLGYPACDVRVPCCHLWPTWLDYIFYIIP